MNDFGGYESSLLRGRSGNAIGSLSFTIILSCLAELSIELSILLRRSDIVLYNEYGKLS
jgi:hypothetical protein